VDQAAEPVASSDAEAVACGRDAHRVPPCRERDIAYALIVSRAVRPASKLSTGRWREDGGSTPGTDLGVAGASTDEVCLRGEHF